MRRLLAALLLLAAFVVVLFSSDYGLWVFLGCSVAGVLIAIRDVVLGQ